MAEKKTNTVKVGANEYRLFSRWQNVWGNWQFWWEFKKTDGEWETDSNGDLEWAKRMSAHYKVNITGEYAESEK